MKIFSKRPLSLILCITLSIFVLVSVPALWVCGAVFILILAGLLVSSLKILPKAVRMLIRLTSLLSFLALALSFSYFHLYMRAYERFDESVEIYGIVEDMDTDGVSMDTVTVKAYSVNDKPLSRYRFVTYLDKDDSALLKNGAVIRFNSEITDFRFSKKFYLAKGYGGELSGIENIRIVEYRNEPLRTKITKYRHSVANFIVERAQREDAGGLFAALLTGEMEYLSDKLSIDFKLMGITHILALSGTHLVIIALILEKILTLSRIPKKPRVIITAIAVIAYMVFTGLPSAVTRAGIMFLVTNSLFIIARPRDSVTSLFISVALILIFEPYAIYDIALWLSAFATLGVVVSYDITASKEEDELIKSVKKYVFTSLTASVLAISATVLISNIFFGAISIVSPITTIIFSVLCDLYIYVGLIMLIVTSLFPSLTLLTPLYLVIEFLSDIITEIDGIYASVDFVSTKILTIILTVALVVFLIIPIKNRLHGTAAIASLLTSLFIVAYFANAILTHSGGITYLSRDEHDAIIINENFSATLVNFQKHDKNSAYTTAEFVIRAKLTELDNYVITEYSGSVTDMVASLCGQIKIDTLYAPAPLCNEEKNILDSLYEIAKAVDAEVKTFGNDGLKLGKSTLFPIYRQPLTDGYGSCIYTILHEDKFYTYMSSGIFLDEGATIAEKYLNGNSAIILGDYGKSSESVFYFDYRIPNVDTLIVNADEFVFSSGCDSYYQESGTEIYFGTDILNISK